MKKVIVTILLTYSISGFAVKWEKISQNYDGNSIYIDLDSIEKKESRVYYSNLIDFLEPKQKNYSVVIFPEGTRVAYGEQSSLKKGIFKILDVLKMQSILMNHDAGKYWSKSSFIIRPGVISIETISLKYSCDMDVIRQRIINHFA